jgi:hypothetical protein
MSSSTAFGNVCMNTRYLIRTDKPLDISGKVRIRSTSSANGWGSPITILNSEAEYVQISWDLNDRGVRFIYDGSDLYVSTPQSYVSLNTVYTWRLTCNGSGLWTAYWNGSQIAQLNRPFSANTGVMWIGSVNAIDTPPTFQQTVELGPISFSGDRNVYGTFDVGASRFWSGSFGQQLGSEYNITGRRQLLLQRRRTHEAPR